MNFVFIFREQVNKEGGHDINKESDNRHGLMAGYDTAQTTMPDVVWAKTSKINPCQMSFKRTLKTESFMATHLSSLVAPRAAARLEAPIPHSTADEHWNGKTLQYQSAVSIWWAFKAPACDENILNRMISG